MNRCEDLDLLTLLDIEIFEPDFRHDFSKTVNWVLRYKGQPVGFACAKELSKKYLYFERAGLVEEHRGLGLHRRLIKNRVKYARDNNLKAVITYTALDNPGSGNNLIRHGFKLYNPEYAWAGTDFIYYILEL